MRIRSSFRDYYDAAAAYGQDQTLIYDRFPRTERLDHYPFSSYYRLLGGGGSLSVRFHTVGFCGKFFKLLELNLPSTHTYLPTKQDVNKNRKWCYSIEDVDGYVRHHFPKKYDVYLEKEFRRGSGWEWYQRHHSFVEFFSTVRNQHTSGVLPGPHGQAPDDESNRSEEWRQQWFQDRCPLFVATVTRHNGGEITYNSPLKQYDFFRLYDTAQAYQEIMMWLANQAVPIKPIPEIPDDTMRDIKGFDKFSFRKDPSGKKKKRFQS